MKWRVYYGDGTTFSNEDGDVEDVPSRDVQVVVQVDTRTGWSPLYSNDYYWYDKGEWIGGDLFGLFDYLTRPGWKKVLFGRTISHEEYQTIVRRARQDKDFPRKSAKLRGEH